MVKQSTAVSSETTTKKPRAPRKKKILVDVETAALKIPAVVAPVEGSYEIVTSVPENYPLETREPPKLSATFTPSTLTPGDEPFDVFIQRVSNEASMITVTDRAGGVLKMPLFHTVPPETVEMKIDHSYSLPESPELPEAQSQAIAKQVQSQIERNMYTQISESQPVMPVVNVRAEEISPDVTLQADKFVVQHAIENMNIPPIRPLVVSNNSPGIEPMVGHFNDLSKYTFIKPDGSTYIGEAERVAREEAETLAKSITDGYFTPTRAVTKRFDFLPRERKKVIIALVAGIFCLLGLIALATLAFFGEIGIFS